MKTLSTLGKGILQFLSKLMTRPFVSASFIIVLLLFVHNNFLYKKSITANDLYISADGRGYYEYLPAFFLYDDLNLHYLDTLQTPLYSAEYADHIFPIQTELGHRINKYFVGTALLQAPFFGIAHWVASSSDSLYPADGYSLPYQKGIFAAALFYLFLGLVGIRYLLQTYFVSGIGIFIVQLALVFATPLLHYTIYDSAYSHVYSFCLITWFLYYLRKYFTTQLSLPLVLCVFLFGVIASVRPINILILLFAPLLTDSIRSFLLLVKTMVLRHFKGLLLGCLLAAVVVSVQFYISYAQSGNPLHYSYGEEGFDFLNPNIINFLFSYHKGFFLWTPWWFFAFLFGIIYGLLQRKFYFISYSSFSFIVLVYILSSWHIWTYGASLGSRPLIDFYAVFVLILVPFLQQGRRLMKFIFILLTSASTFLMQVQTYQYQFAIIHLDGMDKEKYWKTFMQLDRKYSWYLYRTTLAVGPQLSDISLLEEPLVTVPRHNKTVLDPIFKAISVDSTAQFWELYLHYDREAEGEYMTIHFFDAQNTVVDSFEYLQLFHYHQAGTESMIRFPLDPTRAPFYSKIGIYFENFNSKLRIDTLRFRTYGEKE